jgi:hypothetical protein
MIKESAGKIMIETKEDKRLDVAMELAKTVTILSEMLKTMETSISNIHINGCTVQTAPGETAIYMGNRVNHSSITNSLFRTDYPAPNLEEEEEGYGEDENDEDEEEFNSKMFDSKEEQDEWRMQDLMLKPAKDEENDANESTLRRYKTAFESVNQENQKYRKLVDAMIDIFESARG